VYTPFFLELSTHGDRYDDEIFEHLKLSFPEVVQEPYEKLVKIDEDMMKNEEGKTKWREFINS